LRGLVTFVFGHKPRIILQRTPKVIRQGCQWGQHSDSIFRSHPKGDEHKGTKNYTSQQSGPHQRDICHRGFNGRSRGIPLEKTQKPHNLQRGALAGERLVELPARSRGRLPGSSPSMLTTPGVPSRPAGRRLRRGASPRSRAAQASRSRSAQVSSTIGKLKIGGCAQKSSFERHFTRPFYVPLAPPRSFRFLENSPSPQFARGNITPSLRCEARHERRDTLRLDSPQAETPKRRAVLLFPKPIFHAIADRPMASASARHTPLNKMTPLQLGKTLAKSADLAPLFAVIHRHQFFANYLPTF